MSAPALNIVTSGQLSRESGVPQSTIQTLTKNGELPSHRLDGRRNVYDLDASVDWLIEHGHLVDKYRGAIKQLVDSAPPLTAEQAAKIKAVLGGAE